MKRLFLGALFVMAAASSLEAAVITSYVQVNPPNGKQPGGYNVGRSTVTTLCFDDTTCQSTASEGGGGSGSSIYPATSTIQAPYGAIISSLTVSTVTVSGQIVFKDGTILISTSTFGKNLSVTYLGVPIVSSATRIDFEGPGVSVVGVGSEATVTISSWSGGGSMTSGATYYWNIPSTGTFVDPFGAVFSTVTLSTITVTGRINFGDGTTIRSSSTFIQGLDIFNSEGPQKSSMTIVGPINTNYAYYLGNDRFIWNDGNSQCIGQNGTCNSGGGQFNTIVGGGAALNLTNTAQQNVCIGGGTCVDLVGGSSTDGDLNTVVGYGAGDSLVSGAFNTCIGHGTCNALIDGDNNTYVGGAAGDRDVHGNYNTALGSGAGNDIVTGWKNTCIGNKACHSITDGSSNTLVGFGEGYNGGPTDWGISALGFGAHALAATELSNATAIGYLAVATSSNTIKMGANGEDAVRVLMSTAVVTWNISAGSVTITSLTGQSCIGTDSAGNVQAGACGGGGGSSSLGVNLNGVSVTSPTAQINVTGTGLSVTAVGSTATFTLNSNLPGASTSYIQNRSTLQTGTTAYPDFVILGSSLVRTGFGVTGFHSPLSVFSRTTNLSGTEINTYIQNLATPAAPSSLKLYAEWAAAQWQSADANPSGAIIGSIPQGIFYGPGSIGSISGSVSQGAVTQAGASFVTYGSKSQAYTAQGSSSSFQYGSIHSTFITEGSTVTQNFNLYVSTVNYSTNSVIPNNYGVFIDSMEVQGLGGTINWGLYQWHSAPNRLGGTLSLPRGASASTFTITGLTSQPCIGTDGSGNVQAGTCSGSGGYAVEPATVTFNLAKGVIVSTLTASQLVTVSSTAIIQSLVTGTTDFGTYGSSGTVTFDFTKGNNGMIVLTSSVTFNGPSNPVDNQQFKLVIKQDTTGSRIVNLASGAGNFAFGTDITSYTATTTGSAIDYVGCVYSASKNRWNVVAISKGY